MELKFPNRIRELRDARDWSVRELGVHAGMDFNKVHRIEKGDRAVELGDLRRIARALGVKPSALLLDADVELRLDDDAQAILEALDAIPKGERAGVLRVASELSRVIRGVAASRTGALSGDEQQVAELADTWNGYSPEGRARALQILRAADGA